MPEIAVHPDELNAELGRRESALSIEEEAEQLAADLSLFIRRAWHVVWPTVDYLHNWHIDLICERLEKVTAGEILRLQVWVPPGSMKSSAVSIFWPAWEWARNPGLRYWTASYGTTLSQRLTSQARDLIMSPWYQARWGHMFRMRKTNEAYYSNDQGGTRLATSPDATGIGEHGHRIVIDDPINAKDADATSKSKLNAVNEWYDGTVPGRAADPKRTAQVLIMQRLHEEDLAAHVLTIEQWQVLCLPERYERNHPHVSPDDPRTVEGELLWPERRGEAESDTFARTLTSHRAAGQLQQRPSAREGDLLKRQWWMVYPSDWRDDISRYPTFGVVIQSWDTPLKDKESNDLIAGQCWGVHGGDRYLLEATSGHMNFTGAKRAVKQMAEWARGTWPNARHHILVENGGYGADLIRDLRREITGVVKVNPGKDGDKVMRAEAASADLESGNCWLPGHPHPAGGPDEHESPSMTMELVNDAAAFPNSTYKDRVDAWSQAMNWLRRNAEMRGRIASPASAQIGKPARVP